MNSPSFQFYPADFLVGVAGMTNEQVGVYMKLLCYQWAKGALEDDMEVLCSMTYAPVTVVTKCLQKFALKDGFWRNEKLESVRQNHLKWITKSSEAGKKSALKRWGSRHKNRVTLVTECLPFGCNQSGNQSVTLLSSSSVQKESVKKKPDKPPAGPKGPALADEVFIAELKRNYPDIDIDREMRNMRGYLLTPKAKGRQMTRRFVVSWLNRCDAPISGGGNSNGHKESKSGQWAGDYLTEREGYKIPES